MLNQAGGDRQILAKQLGISSHQLSYVTQSNAGEGLLFYGNTIIPFVDRYPKDGGVIYSLLTTKLTEMQEISQKDAKRTNEKTPPKTGGLAHET